MNYSDITKQFITRDKKLHRIDESKKTGAPIQISEWVLDLLSKPKILSMKTRKQESILYLHNWQST